MQLVDAACAYDIVIIIKLTRNMEIGKILEQERVMSTLKDIIFGNAEPK